VGLFPRKGGHRLQDFWVFFWTSGQKAFLFPLLSLLVGGGIVIL
jgi:hypothetical protein